MLQPVADEARNVAMHEYRVAAGAPQRTRELIGCRTVCRPHQHDLDQRHEMRRIPEMRTEHAMLGFEILRNERDRQCRRVTGEDRVCWRGPFEFCEDRPLERQLFERSFNDNSSILRRPRYRLARGYAVGDRAICAKQIANVTKPLVQRLACRRKWVLHAYFVTACRKQISNAVAHQAGADYRDARLFHAG